jgi:predicted acyl esterase
MAADVGDPDAVAVHDRPDAQHGSRSSHPSTDVQDRRVRLQHAAGMASVRKEILIDARPDDVWEALRDWAAVHQRLVPGFVVDTRLDGEDRIVTFFNGAAVRELLVDLDDDARRLVWSVADGPYTHHNASAQVFSEEDGRTRFVWLADLLPNTLAGRMNDMMEHGSRVIKQTMEA